MESGEILVSSGNPLIPLRSIRATEAKWVEGKRVSMNSNSAGPRIAVPPTPTFCEHPDATKECQSEDAPFSLAEWVGVTRPALVVKAL